MPLQAGDCVPGARRLEPAHVAQEGGERPPIDAHQSNEETGEHLSDAGRMMRTGRLRQRFHGAFFKHRQCRTPLGTYLFQPQLVRADPCDHDEIHPIRQQFRPRAKALTADPLDPVPPDGRPYRSGNDEPQPSPPRRGRLGRHQQGEMRRPHALSRPLGADELRVAPEPLEQRLLLVDRGRQALAALAATVLQDFAPALRRHTGAEAVRARSADVVGLVGALHVGVGGLAYFDATVQPIK